MKELTLTDSNFAKDLFRGGNKKVVTQCDAMCKKKIAQVQKAPQMTFTVCQDAEQVINGNRLLRKERKNILSF